MPGFRRRRLPFLLCCLFAGTQTAQAAVETARAAAPLNAAGAAREAVGEEPAGLDLPVDSGPVVKLRMERKFNVLAKKKPQQLMRDTGPVIGWSTLTYFWHKKTPEQVTADLLDLLDHYRQRWPNRTWVLIGFSFGAEIVPFIINRLPAAERARLLAGVMLSPSTESDFEIHVSDWVSSNKYQGYATQPETERISDIPLFCFYGQEDDDPDVLCPLLTQHNVTNIALPGGHHFEDDYPWMVTLLHRHIPLSR